MKVHLLDRKTVARCTAKNVQISKDIREVNCERCLSAFKSTNPKFVFYNNNPSPK